jgi:hypothetical protein
MSFKTSLINIIQLSFHQQKKNKTDCYSLKVIFLMKKAPDFITLIAWSIIFKASNIAHPKLVNTTVKVIPTLNTSQLHFRFSKECLFALFWKVEKAFYSFD